MRYTTPSERRDAPEGTREAFPEIAWEDLKVSQEEGPVDMIISRDNPEWMPVPMQEEPYERFTLMWTSLSPHYILRENTLTHGDGIAGEPALEAAAQPNGGPIGGVFCTTVCKFFH